MLLITDKKDVDGSTIGVIQTIDVRSNVNKKYIKSNKVITTYSNADTDLMIEEAKRNNRVLYMDKKRSQMLGNVGRRLSPAEYTKIDFEENIQQFWDNFNYLRKKDGKNILEKEREASKNHPFANLDFKFDENSNKDSDLPFESKTLAETKKAPYQELFKTNKSPRAYGRTEPELGAKDKIAQGKKEVNYEK